MTEVEKQLVKDLFLKFKALYCKQKVTDDLIEKMLQRLPDDTITLEERIRIEEVDARITETELNSIEQRIKNL